MEYTTDHATHDCHKRAEQKKLDGKEWVCVARVSDCKARDGAWEAAVGPVAALREQCLRL